MKDIDKDALDLLELKYWGYQILLQEELIDGVFLL